MCSSEEYFLREIIVDSLPSNGLNAITIWQKFECDVGSVVWDSALMLAKYLDYNSVKLNLKSSKVVELGSGTGFCGIFCSTLGSHVIITDLDHCLELMLKNVEQNKSLINDRVIVKPWNWSQTKPNIDNECQLFFDWNLNQIDYILVSDCIYYEQSVEQLYETIVWLSSKGAIVLLSYEERESKRHLINQFFNLISNNLKLEHKSVPFNELHPDYKSHDLLLIQIKCIL